MPESFSDDTNRLAANDVKGNLPLSSGCLCGAVRYTVNAAPRVHYCHCDMCRRATGSAFAVLAWCHWAKSCGPRPNPPSENPLQSQIEASVRRVGRR